MQEHNAYHDITHNELPVLDKTDPSLQIYIEPSIDKHVITEGKIYRAELHNVRLPDGSQARRELVYHSGGAGIVAVDDEGYTWLVAQYRKALEDFVWEIPAGKLEESEDPRLTAERELKEETGLSAGKMQHIGNLIATPGYNSEIIHIYYASDLTVGSSKPDPGEYLMQVRLPLEAALRAVKQGRILDAKTCYGLLYVWNLRNGALNDI